MDVSDLPLSQRLSAALALQRAAYHAQPAPSYEERRQDLKRLQAFLRDHQEAIADAISADYGHRSRHETRLAEIAPAVDGISHALKHLKSWMKVQRRSADWISFPLARNRVIPQPLGVVGVIVPWNFPVNLSFVPLTAIFAAGNRAMVKLSENSRHLAALLIDKVPAYFRAREAAVLRRDRRRGHRVLAVAVRPPAVHRLRHHRARGDGGGGAEPVPGDAGAGRQVAGDRGAGLPARYRGRAHPVRQVHERRPDLHHGRPCLAAGRQGRRVRAPGSSHRAAHVPVAGVARLHLDHRRQVVRAPARHARRGARARRARDPAAAGAAVRRRHAQDRAAHRARCTRPTRR